MLLKTAIDRFDEGYFSTCNRSEKTRRAYRIDLEQFRRFIGDDVALAEIDPDNLESWADRLQREDYKSSSIRRKFAALKVFFGYWVRKGTLESSPLWRIRLDLVRERQLPRCLSVDDMRSLLLQARREYEDEPQSKKGGIDRKFLALRNLAIIEVLFATGMRVGELVGLQMSDVRLTEHRFLVRGKGGRQRIAMLPDPRSREAFEMYHQERAATEVDHDQIFLNVFGDGLSTQGVAVALRKIADSAGIAVRVTPQHAPSHDCHLAPGRWSRSVDRAGVLGAYVHCDDAAVHARVDGADGVEAGSISSEPTEWLLPQRSLVAVNKACHFS